MKKYSIIAILFSIMVLTGCARGQKVSIAKERVDLTTSYEFKSSIVQENKIPENATAICRDGSFSFQKNESTCIGNGGVKTVINRYSSE